MTKLLGSGADGPEDAAFDSMLNGDCAQALKLSEARSGVG
jgi:hypothetical protein